MASVASATLIARTPRLVLSELSEDDAGFFLDVLNDPGFIANIADRGVRTLEQSVAYLREGPIASYARHGHGMWKLTRDADGVALGICGLIRRPALRSMDLGYALLREHAGHGYATEAAHACVELAFGRFHADELLAIVKPGHAASLRVLGKLGFVEEGRVRLAPDDEELVQLVLRPPRDRSARTPGSPR